jgi:DNA-binding IclR family transcriptional regulator
MNRTQTLSRALDILFALSDANGTLTVSEIAEKVSIAESTTYRFLQTLERNGIVERKGKSQIGLGMRILDLARSLNQQNYRDLLSLALPIMNELTESTQETSVLFIRSGVSASCIQHVRSKGLLQFAIENGRSLPLHSGASGKVILAYESAKVTELVLRSLPENVDRQALLLELQHIRGHGVCLTKGEVDPDIYAVAAPILDHQQTVVASLSIAGPSFRYDSRFKDKVIAAAEQLSTKLGAEQREGKSDQNTFISY